MMRVIRPMNVRPSHRGDARQQGRSSDRSYPQRDERPDRRAQEDGRDDDYRRGNDRGYDARRY